MTTDKEIDDMKLRKTKQEMDNLVKIGYNLALKDIKKLINNEYEIWYEPFETSAEAISQFKIKLKQSLKELEKK
jgi:hypothetical protein